MEAIPKVGVLFQVDQKVRGDDDQSPPCVLTEGKIVELLSKIQLGPDLCFKQRKEYEDLLCKYIHMFASNYKDFREIIMVQHKIELLRNVKLIITKQGRWNPKYITIVKEELDKLFKARFIKLMETIEWVSLVVLAFKKYFKLKVCVNYKAFNKIILKNRYLSPFVKKKLE